MKREQNVLQSQLLESSIKNTFWDKLHKTSYYTTNVRLFVPHDRKQKGNELFKRTVQ